MSPSICVRRDSACGKLEAINPAAYVIDSFQENTDTSLRADLSSACGARKTFQLKRVNPL
jgi:hypothetical protein